MEQKNNGKAIAALVLGILGIVGAWIPFVNFIAWVFPIIAIVLGAKAKKECAEAGQPTGMATAGLVLGIVSLGLTVLGLICVICATIGIAAVGGLDPSMLNP
ncbi:MAG: DUF4190 domain-containing protein [Eubacterium sp.]|jgi:hypothetical protein|nr:DUF4190 domain-containing protein [Eubacterium sp.]